MREKNKRNKGEGERERDIHNARGKGERIIIHTYLVMHTVSGNEKIMIRKT